MTLDRHDRLILDVLQKDGRISNVQLAGHVNLSESACLRRVRALEDEGLIDSYAALLNQSKAGLSGNVFVHIGLHREEQSELAAFEEAVKGIPEVMECYLMTGDADYMMRVVVADLPAYERFLMDRLTRIEGIASIKSSFSLKQVVHRTALPMGHLGFGAALPPV